MGALTGRWVLVIGRGSGIARAVTLAAVGEGADVVVAGRDAGALASAYAGEAARAATVDVADEASIAALAASLGRVDHVVTTASARARGAVGDLDAETVARSFAVKAIGPDPPREAPRADHAAGRIVRPVLRRDRDPAPSRHARRGRDERGGGGDVARAVLFALTASFVTGASIPVDGGELLV